MSRETFKHTDLDESHTKTDKNGKSQLKNKDMRSTKNSYIFY